MNQEEDELASPVASPPLSRSEEHLGSPSSASFGKMSGAGPSQTIHPRDNMRRAPQACLRCRRQKLRCSGTWPCERCQNRKIDCDFTSEARRPRASRGKAGSSKPLLNDTELPPETDLGAMHEGDNRSSTSTPSSSAKPNSRQLDVVTKHSRDKEQAAVVRRLSSEPSATPVCRPVVPPRSHLLHSLGGQPRRDIFRNGADARPPQPSSSANDLEQQSAALQVPDDSATTSMDPIKCGIVTAELASILHTFFMQHCLPYLPLFNPEVDSPEALQSLSSFLFTTVLAVGARFISGHRKWVDFPPKTTTALVALAERHLFLSLLRRRHTVSDIQALMLCSNWRFEGLGGGVDAWLVGGHALRIAQQLWLQDVHLLVKERDSRQAEDIPEDEYPVWLRGWRTWVFLYSHEAFLSLGYGRPSSTLELGEGELASFIDASLRGPRTTTAPPPFTDYNRSLDMFIACRAQLALISNRFSSWIETMSRRNAMASADTEAALVTYDVLTEINECLDDWCRTWVWNGSQYGMHLGTFTQNARLLSEHVRLSVNSIALQYTLTDKAPPWYNAPPSFKLQEKVASQWLKKALNSATSTIQIHHDSSVTDLSLSCSPDYLTLALGQAAVFLLRLSQTRTEWVKTAVSLDMHVAAHYVKMSAQLLEATGISKGRTSMSASLARLLRASTGSGDPLASGSAGLQTNERSTSVGTLEDDVSTCEGLFDLDDFMESCVNRHSGLQ